MRELLLPSRVSFSLAHSLLLVPTTSKRRLLRRLRFGILMLPPKIDQRLLIASSRFELLRMYSAEVR